MISHSKSFLKAGLVFQPRHRILAVAVLLAGYGATAHAASVLNGVAVDLTWVTGPANSLSVYQNYVPNTVGSGTEFQACSGGTYLCSGGPGSAIETTLTGTGIGHDIPNNAVSVDLSDISNSFTIFGGDNYDNTFFGNFGSGNINGFEISIDESSAESLLGQDIFFTDASIFSSSGNWTGGSTPSIFAISPTSIFVNFSALPSGPTDACSGLQTNTPCPNPTGTANDVVVNYSTETISATPEPSSILLLCTGFGGILAAIRRKRSA